MIGCVISLLILWRGLEERKCKSQPDVWSILGGIKELKMSDVSTIAFEHSCLFLPMIHCHQLAVALWCLAICEYDPCAISGFSCWIEIT
jgi:hypothetical protein